MRYVLEGPADCGNTFGFWKENLVPSGKFAVVEDDELSNGGRGPCSVDGKLYAIREQANAAIAADAGHETCSQCGDNVGHLMFDGVCANCRNANLRDATVQIDE